MLSKTDRPTALFCFADSIAYGAYAAARELGLRIPDEVSVSGYDDHPMSALLTPALTTMDWNVDGIVRAAVRLILAAIERKALPPPHRPATAPARARLHGTASGEQIKEGTDDFKSQVIETRNEPVTGAVLFLLERGRDVP